MKVLLPFVQCCSFVPLLKESLAGQGFAILADLKNVKPGNPTD